jgi:conjugal transfer protein trbG/virB9/cagX
MKMKKQLTIALTCATMALPIFGATNQSRQNFLSNDSASKLQVKKIISGKQEALKRVSASFDYYTDAVYDIYVTPDFITRIKLDPKETIQNIIAGSSDSFEIQQDFGGADNAQYLFITAKDLDVTSNINVITDKRIYTINLFSTLEVFNPIVTFNYPAQGNTLTYPLTSANGNTISTGRDRLNVATKDLDFNYEIKGKTANFAPQQVYTDGVQTVITMPSNIQEAPVILVKGVSGDKYEVVNFEYEKNKIIVHRVIKEAVLKLGKKTVTIKHR